MTPLTKGIARHERCHSCGLKLTSRYGINLTWVGGPPQRAWCHRWWCRAITRLRRIWNATMRAELLRRLGE